MELPVDVVVEIVDSGWQSEQIILILPSIR